MLSRPPDPGTLAGIMRDAALAEAANAPSWLPSPGPALPVTAELTPSATEGTLPRSSDQSTSAEAAKSTLGGLTKPTAAPSPTPLLGMRVMGLFNRGPDEGDTWDAGTIKKVRADGLFDIKYDKGNKETKVGWGYDLIPLEYHEASSSNGTSSMNDELVLADAMREAALNENAGAAKAGFCDVWRTRAATAIDVAVREARERAQQPEVDAYARLEGLHGSMSALLLEAQKADEADFTVLA